MVGSTKKLLTVVAFAQVVSWVSPLCVDAATLSEIFADAEDAFRYQDYRRAVQLYDSLLASPEIGEDLQRKLLILEHVGASRWFLGQTESAEREFANLLLASPNARLNGNYYPPELVRFFEAVRARMAAQTVIPPKDDKGTDKGQGEQPVFAVTTIETVTIEKNPFITTLIPFGGGQFQNGDVVGGAIFLTSETLALASTITMYFLILDSRNDPELAQQYEVAFWVSEGVFLGLVAAGIIEAMVNHRSESPPNVQRRNVFEPNKSPSSAPPSSFAPILGVGRNSSVFMGFSQTF